MSDYKVIFTATAEEGLLDIIGYIALDNPTRAESFIRELVTSLRKTLATFPKSGRVVDELGFTEEIRMVPYRNYNSYYRVSEAKQLVEVLFILNGRREVSRFLSGLDD